MLTAGSSSAAAHDNLELLDPYQMHKHNRLEMFEAELTASDAKKLGLKAQDVRYLGMFVPRRQAGPKERGVIQVQIERIMHALEASLDLSREPDVVICHAPVALGRYRCTSKP